MENNIIANQKPRKFKNQNIERKQKQYSSQEWKNLSLIYKQEHPLCECCLVHDRIKSVEEVHHAVKFDD